MQFGSGYGAQTILLPQEADEMTARAAQAREQAVQARQQSQLGEATLPDKIATSALSLVDAQSSSMVKNTGNAQALIANAAALATTPEEWDDAMQGLADKGIPQARQFIGRFSEQLKGRVANAYGASSPSSALAAMQSDSPTGSGGAASGLASVGGVAGAGVTSGSELTPMEQKLATLPPPALKALYDKTERVRSAVEAVAQSRNPAAEWDKEAAAMGHPEWVGHYSGQSLQQLTEETMPLSNTLRGMMTRQGLGMPAPVVPAKIDKVGDQLFSIDETDPAHPKVTPLTEGKATFVGTDADGHAIYYNPDTKKETRGEASLTTSRYSRAGNSVYAAKQAAWLSVHPGDAAGALQYAAGSGGKNLSPEQIQVAAMHQAVQEMSAQSLAGNPPKDPEAFVRSRAQEIAQDISSKAETGTTPGSVPPGTPRMSSAQQQALARFKAGAGTKPGTKINPLIPRSSAEYAAMKPDTWFVDTDGTLVQKGR